MTTTGGIRSALCVCLVLVPLATVAAQVLPDETSGGTGLYVSAAYGVALPADRTIGEEKLGTELGFLGGQVGLGFHLFGFRPELAAGYGMVAIEDSDGEDSVTSLDVIASLYLDVGTGIPIVPYIGVGGGVSQFSIRQAGEGRTVWPLAVQAAAGIGFTVLRDLTLTLGYRMRGTLGTKFPDTEELLKMGLTHNAEVGLRYSF